MTNSTTGTDSLFKHVSDTATIVARIRAVESQRPDRLFNDPLAQKFSGRRGEELANEAKKNLVLRTLAQSMNLAIVVRTKLIDEIIETAVNDFGCDCVVNIGAGLDARPFRLRLPQDLLWIEVDFAGLIEHKEKLSSGDQAFCRVERRKLDINDQTARTTFFDSLREQGKKILVITEGLLLYLNEKEIRDLSAQMLACGNIKRWVADINSPLTVASMEKFWGLQLGRSVKFKFAADRGADFFAQLGWKVRNELPVYEEANRFKRSSPLTGVRKGLGMILGEGFKARIRRSSVVFELGAP